MKQIVLRLCWWMIAGALPFSTHSQDRVFARIYQTNILPKGVKDLESWTTFRFGRENFYSRIDQRLEFEIGVAKRLQSALYLNISHLKFAEITNGNLAKETETAISVSSEWKVKFSDPAANVLGTGLYAEATVGPDEFELEGKLLLDKIFGKNLIAFNAVGEAEWEAETELKDGEFETKIELEKTPVELDLGYMYLASIKFGIGIELRNHNLITKEDGWVSSAFFGGPTVYYNAENWWIMLNVLPQWANFKSSSMEGARDLIWHEKAEIRILFSLTIP
ncbi:MAG TPA: hypothetical protein VNJ07_00195 [Chitinophagales bacterium]|nr:hypothetical protein [Chitinophagales bacterium]